MPRANKDVEKSELSYAASGNIKMYNLENSLAVFFKVKHIFTIQMSNPIPYVLQRKKNLCSHKNPYTNVYRGLIHNH